MYRVVNTFGKANKMKILLIQLKYATYIFDVTLTFRRGNRKPIVRDDKAKHTGLVPLTSLLTC